MIWKPSGTDVHVERRARDQAYWLVRDHGDEAEGILEAKMRREDVSAADIYRYRLTYRELQRIRREEEQERDEERRRTNVTVWQPRFFSSERLLRLFGIRAVDRRKRPRP